MTLKKTILITGVSRGIGYSLAKEFLKNNWHVIGTTRKNNAPMDLLASDCFQHKKLDVTDIVSIASLADTLQDIPIDVLVNNAGILDSASVEDENIISDINMIAQVYLTNIVGPRLVSEALVQNIRTGKEKLIVAMSSIVGTYSNLDSFHALHWIYGSSKAGLNYAMNAFAVTYPEIKVSLVRPGWVRTDMGGSHATLSPEESAQHIFSLIHNHKEKLPANKLVSHLGEVMELWN